MKPVPDSVARLGPEGTEWHGGTVDLTRMSLRVRAPSEAHAEITAALGCSPNRIAKVWSLSASASPVGDLDGQVAWLLGQVTSDLAKWKRVTAQWRVDIFCGLFLERPNRGVAVSATTMRMLAERNIELGLDIYAPD